MKNLFAVLFVLQVFSLFGQDANYFEYEVNGTGNSQTITITGYNGDLKSICIPERINNIPVAIIGDGTFFNKGLTRVIIPETIITIKTHAFERNNLTRVILPSSLQSIEDSAFSYNSLMEILLPSNLQSIGNSAFSNNRLTEIFISPNVIFVGRSAFLNNPLQRIIIGKNVTLEAGLIPDLPDIWEQFAAHYNNSGKQSGIYNTQ